MSWQQYVDSLMATKHMTNVGIFGLDGSQWAASPGFPVSLTLFFFKNFRKTVRFFLSHFKIATDGIKLIISSVADSTKMQNGLTVNGDRYILVRSDPNISIMLKKGQNGVVAYKSSQSIHFLFVIVVVVVEYS